MHLLLIKPAEISVTPAPEKQSGRKTLQTEKKISVLTGVEINKLRMSGVIGNY